MLEKSKLSAARIRSLTVGLDPAQQDPRVLKSELDDLFVNSITALSSLNLEIQTKRLTLPPLSANKFPDRFHLNSYVDTVSRLATDAGVRWLCLPIDFSQVWDGEDLQKSMVAIIQKHPNVFLNFLLSAQEEHCPEAVLAIGKIILAISKLSNNGFDNFRVGIGCNIKPNTPFFPFSYQQGQKGFSYAVELIGPVLELLESNPSVPLDCLQAKIIDRIVEIIAPIDQQGKNIESLSGYEYKGMDISFAPYPDGYRSVGRLIELLGIDHCAQVGTLFLTGFLTRILKAALFRSAVRVAGFNGVMFSLLEDFKLAESNNKRFLSLEKLMVYSSVCGCGLDMIPVPGDVFPEEIASVTLDLAALSTILNKPLGLRILPIPMKAANEITDFNHDFLVNTRIMPMGGQGLGRGLAVGSNFSLESILNIVESTAAK